MACNAAGNGYNPSVTQAKPGVTFVKKGRHRRFEEARAMKRSQDVDFDALFDSLHTDGDGDAAAAVSDDWDDTDTDDDWDDSDDDE
jgi:hypothetical protein